MYFNKDSKPAIQNSPAMMSKMRLHGKSCQICMHVFHQEKKQPSSCIILYDNNPISTEFQPNYKYLGLVLDTERKKKHTQK